MAFKAGRIDETRFATQTLSAASSGIALFTPQPVNGEIVQISSSFNQNGSLVIATSGISTNELWRLNASSGTNPTVSYPGHLMQDTIGSGAGFGTAVPFVVNDKLKLSTGSLTSGASAVLDVVVWYR